MDPILGTAIASSALSSYCALNGNVFLAISIPVGGLALSYISYRYKWERLEELGALSLFCNTVLLPGALLASAIHTLGNGTPIAKAAACIIGTTTVRNTFNLVTNWIATGAAKAIVKAYLTR